MLHGSNSLHNTDQCCALQKDEEKHQKEQNNKFDQNKKFQASKEGLHTLIEFSKHSMAATQANPNTNKEFETFNHVSVSSNDE